MLNKFYFFLLNYVDDAIILNNDTLSILKLKNIKRRKILDFTLLKGRLKI